MVTERLQALTVTKGFQALTVTKRFQVLTVTKRFQVLMMITTILTEKIVADATDDAAGLKSFSWPFKSLPWVV